MRDRKYLPASASDEDLDIQARIVTWASHEIRLLWEQMREGDDQVEVGRQQLVLLRHRPDFASSVTEWQAEISRFESLVNDSTHVAHRRRQAVIEAIREELVGVEASK